jgi:hypothetical protein
MLEILGRPAGTKTDTQELQNLRESESLKQFISAAPLPTEWATQRLTLVSTPAPIASADAAAKAAAHFRSTFTALVENRLDSAGFASLMSGVTS